ncbi:MAG: histidine phosphatase family protein [Bacteroidota bacterium]
MTKKLLIVRHSEAESIASSRKDFDRSLTEKGMVYANKQGRKLYESEFKPDYFVCSSAERAKKTAHILADQMHFDQRNIDALEAFYSMPMGGMLDWLKNLEEDKKEIMVVGHNPVLSYLVEYITGKTGFHMNPCDLVMVELKIESWLSIEKDCGVLLWKM